MLPGQAKALAADPLDWSATEALAEGELQVAPRIAAALLQLGEIDW